MKRIISLILITIVATTASWNFYRNNQDVKLSELALANVEALAQNEGIYPHGICYQTLSFEYVFPSYYVIYCLGCQTVKAVLYSNISNC
ncbi:MULTISPECIES: NVEALA domain-containing protein [Parabacteroides]|uniref:NVEALA domain-containing protein n=1 Tax=Parabacteroides leei TaxID=2939491 RepID=UPI001897C977|nr:MULTISPECIES: NVEALA domain-containing protein [Parabacteroides]MCL3852749.1 NVEALA domain-containing protein [Parabacteroides leei]